MYQGMLCCASWREGRTTRCAWQAQYVLSRWLGPSLGNVKHACRKCTIIDLLRRNPRVIYQLDWRKWEEIIAGAYKEQGFDVVLTPRSNDKGRDVIATSRGVGCIRYFDQVKAYGSGHLVTADDVRTKIGVLTLEGNVSKGIITTTLDFALGVLADKNIKRLMPYRLELKPRDALLEWLRTIATNQLTSGSSDTK
jgi:hypothetical protein